MSNPNDPQQHNIKPLNPLYLNPKPTPIAGQCNPLCPYFLCERESLQAFTVNKRGISINKPFCLIIGDTCIGLKCRYSRCRLLAGSVDGRCLVAYRRAQST